MTDAPPNTANPLTICPRCAHRLGRWSIFWLVHKHRITCPNCRGLIGLRNYKLASLIAPIAVLEALGLILPVVGLLALPKAGPAPARLVERGRTLLILLWSCGPLLTAICLWLRWFLINKYAKLQPAPRIKRGLFSVTELPDST